MKAHISPARRFSYMTPLQSPKRRYRRFLQKQCKIRLISDIYKAKMYYAAMIDVYFAHNHPHSIHILVLIFHYHKILLISF